MMALAPAQLTLRVTVADTWTPLVLSASGGETVGAVKARALASQRIDPVLAGHYEVKLGGVLVRDEAASLATLGVADGAGLIVLARRRRAVR